MVSRPSPAASRSTLATRSRSASEARRLRGSGTAGGLLISAKPRRTSVRRYSRPSVRYGNLVRKSVGERSRPNPFGLMGSVGGAAGQLRLGLSKHLRDLPSEVDV